MIDIYIWEQLQIYMSPQIKLKEIKVGKSNDVICPNNDLLRKLIVSSSTN